MSADSILLSMIHTRAVETWIGPMPTAKGYHNWATHWFACAVIIEKEFEAEGLHRTALAIRSIIDDERRYSHEQR